MIMEHKMMLVTDINSKQEFDEMKDIMEIFFIGVRIRHLATQG